MNCYTKVDMTRHPKDVSISHITNIHKKDLDACIIKDLPPPALVQAANPFCGSYDIKKETGRNFYCSGYVTATAITRPYKLSAATGRLFYACAAMCRQWQALPGVVMPLDKLAHISGMSLVRTMNALIRMAQTVYTGTLEVGIDLTGNIYASGVSAYERETFTLEDKYACTMSPMITEVERISENAVYVELPNYMVEYIEDEGWAKAPDRYIGCGNFCYR